MYNNYNIDLAEVLRVKGQPNNTTVVQTYISDKQNLLVRDTALNPVESLIGIGDADEFCLSSVDAAAERPAAVRRLAVVDISEFFNFVYL